MCVINECCRSAEALAKSRSTRISSSPSSSSSSYAWSCRAFSRFIRLLVQLSAPCLSSGPLPPSLPLASSASPCRGAMLVCRCHGGSVPAAQQREAHGDQEEEALPEWPLDEGPGQAQEEACRQGQVSGEPTLLGTYVCTRNQPCWKISCRTPVGRVRYVL